MLITKLSDDILGIIQKIQIQQIKETKYKKKKLII
jgi:hypothetical protein